MSTAPPSDTSTDADPLPALRLRDSNTRHEPANGTPRNLSTTDQLELEENGVHTATATLNRRPAEPLPQSTDLSEDGDLLATEVLEDTKTFRIDDTHVGLPATHAVAATTSSLNRQRLGVDRLESTDLKAPSAVGPLNGAFYELTKRILDLLISVVLLICLSPILLMAAILVKLTDGGSIFYPHTRVGEGGNEFTCFKFRSMVVNAEKMKANLAFYNSHSDHRTFKIPDDPRVTWIGRWMRRTSVDELPQLWNVVKGDMSIVGPRPPVVTEVEQYTWDDMQRLAVKPGLTCIWQVSGRSRLPFPEQLRMDLQYIENRSLALDLKLILMTVPAVVSADGAY